MSKKMSEVERTFYGQLYQAGKEAKEEYLRELLQKMIARRFPKARVKGKLNRIHRMVFLETLCIQFGEIPNENVLHEFLDLELEDDHD